MRKTDPLFRAGFHKNYDSVALTNWATLAREAEQRMVGNCYWVHVHFWFA